jgi:hypothetical protein
MADAKIRFDAPQVVGNLVVVTGRIDNCQRISNGSNLFHHSGNTHNQGLIDVSPFMREVLSFRFVTTQPLDLVLINNGSNLSTTGGVNGSHRYDEVPVTGGSGSGMKIGALIVETRAPLAGTLSLSGGIIFNGDEGKQATLGTGYQVGDIVTADIPTTSGTDKPQFRIVPAGARVHTSDSTLGNNQFKQTLLSSTQSKRRVSRVSTLHTEHRDQVRLIGPYVGETTFATDRVGISGPMGQRSGGAAFGDQEGNSIFGHAKFVIIGKR